MFQQIILSGKKKKEGEIPLSVFDVFFQREQFKQRP